MWTWKFCAHFKCRETQHFNHSVSPIFEPFRAVHFKLKHIMPCCMCMREWCDTTISLLGIGIELRWTDFKEFHPNRHFWVPRKCLSHSFWTRLIWSEKLHRMKQQFIKNAYVELVEFEKIKFMKNWITLNKFYETYKWWSSLEKRTPRYFYKYISLHSEYTFKSAKLDPICLLSLNCHQLNKLLLSRFHWYPLFNSSARFFQSQKSTR